jgi:CHAT domain-containing protein
VLIEYVDSGDCLYAVVLAAGRHTLCPLGPAAPVLADLESLRFAWRRVLTGHGSAASLQAATELAARAASRLDAALLAAVTSLTDWRPLVVVPSGKLQSLPWCMLPRCADRPVTVAPSAQSWLTAKAAAAQAPAPAATARVVLIAGPDVPAAVAELDSLAAIYPGATVLAGHRATISAAQAALDGADVAHVAAHGRFRADNPLFSSLVLADGPLTVYDLERLHRAPRTIMLTACDSGLAQVRPGEEMAGLATALLAVGASTVVAPLLPLPDETGEVLARRSHQLVSSGNTPAAALEAVRAQSGGPAAGLACLGYGG